MYTLCRNLRSAQNIAVLGGFIITLLSFPTSSFSESPTPQQAAPQARWLRLQPAQPVAIPQPKPPTRLPAGHPPTSPSPAAPAQPTSPTQAPMQPAPAAPKAAQAEEAPTLNAEQLRRYHKLTELIISPCCWVQPVSMHPSPASDQIKLDLKKRLASGHTDEQITQAYLKRFGERILAIPPHQDIFWLPIAAAAFVLILAFGLILVWSSRGKHPPTQTN
ncbi:MAG: cytochrome c-type biogenesis protein CcmH [Myxococcales bacterium]|nr:cytochrome c-type biogenesis protein CcmH [Myxococcales bacterium]